MLFLKELKMNTYFLRFENEQEAINALPQFRTDDKEWKSHNDGNDIDVIGVIYKPTGNTINDPVDDFEYPEMEPVGGWHVNFIGILPDDLEQYTVIPNNPVRVFA